MSADTSDGQGESGAKTEIMPGCRARIIQVEGEHTSPRLIIPRATTQRQFTFATCPRGDKQGAGGAGFELSLYYQRPGCSFFGLDPPGPEIDPFFLVCWSRAHKPGHF